MKKGRRQFLKAGVLGGITAAAVSVSTAGEALEKKSEHQSFQHPIGEGTRKNIVLENHRHRVNLLFGIAIDDLRLEELGIRWRHAGHLELPPEVVLNAGEHRSTRGVPLLENQPHLVRANLDRRSHPK